MTNTITGYPGATTTVPELILDWETTQETRNVFHPILFSRSPAVTIRDTTLRSGTLNLLYTNEEDAIACRELHATKTYFSLVSTEIDEANIQKYVVSGAIGSVLEDTTRKMWTISVEYQEVYP
jgi:hypothetical protein